MKDLKNIAKLILMIAYVIAVIGGIGYCCYYKQYLVATCIFLLGVMAWPTFRKMWPEKVKKEEPAAKKIKK